MREFRIKVNNEKTYVVKAKDYNQAVKTLHSKLRDFDDTKKNINVVREFITNNGGKFSKSKDADAILDFIYKKTGVKNADYGDVLYIVKNYTNVKVDDNTINDKPIKKWVLQSTINPILYLGEDKVAVPGAYRGKQFITKSDAEKWYYSMMSEPLGSKNATFKVVEAVVANDSSINDLVSKYNGKDPKQAAAIAYSVQRENDASTGYKYRITNNGSKWYYETTFPDGHTTLTGPYSSKQETEQYFHKHRPTEKLTDADPVKVEKIIRKEKSALGITYYLFQTKSNSGATIYFEVTDKSYHGEPTYSGGGIISFSLQSANDSLDSHLLYDKLVSKYGKDAGRKRFLLGKNDSAVKDSNNIKNRKSYTIKVGDKQYKIFAESEEEAVDKYIKSKRQ